MSTDTLLNPNTTETEYRQHDTGEIKVFGFWIYLMSDCVLFACLFATYAVLANGTAGGVTGKDIFNLKLILVETFLLLFSSITYGMTIISMHMDRVDSVKIWLILTFIFGLAFVAMEIYEFYHFIIKGFSPDRSAFLSSFFALVMTHGIHVCAGLIWIITIMTQVSTRGLTSTNKTRLMCLSLFWHFLDVIWIFLFTFVYLMGVIS